MKHEYEVLPFEGQVGTVDNKKRIEDVEVKQQKLIPDDRGFLMEMLRPDWDIFERWGQVYATMCLPGVVKGWHYHFHQVDFFNCVSGMAKVCLFDNRPMSSTHGVINEFVIGPLNPLMIKIPTEVWHGFTAVGNDPAIIINCPTATYNYNVPDEYRAPADAFGYKWSDVSG